MKQLSFLTVCLLTLLVSNAQTDLSQIEKKQRSFVASIRTIDNDIIKGKIYTVNDSQLVLVRTLNTQQHIPAENIASFTLKRKNSVLRGALIGLGVGAVAGIVVGLASGDDPVNNDPVNDPISGIAVAISNAFAMTAGEKAVVGAFGLGACGAITGIIIGALVKKKFIIGGNKQKFKDLQVEMIRKLVVK